MTSPYLQRGIHDYSLLFREDIFIQILDKTNRSTDRPMAEAHVRIARVEEEDTRVDVIALSSRPIAAEVLHVANISTVAKTRSGEEYST